MTSITTEIATEMTAALRAVNSLTVERGPKGGAA